MNKIIFFLFIIVFLFKTGNVFSANNIFYVDNIIINKRDSQNREMLLNQSFKKGFDKLVKKILLKKDHQLILKTNLKDIKKMISTYQIKNSEDLEKTDELIINLNFDRERMNSFFYSKGVSYADISKTNLVLLPILIENNKLYLFSDNYFFNNWNNNSEDKSSEFIDYILPVESIEDIQLIRSNKDNLESVSVKEILSGYDTKNYIFIVIKPSDNQIDIFLKGIFSDNNIAKNFKIYTNENQNKERKLEEVIIRIKEEINEIWKSQNLIDVRIPSFLNITLNIKKENDLLKVQTKLKEIELIENFYVLELNKNYAKIRIKYLGKTDKMKNQFAKKGIRLENLSNQWKIDLE